MLMPLHKVHAGCGDFFRGDMRCHILHRREPSAPNSAHASGQRPPVDVSFAFATLGGQFPSVAIIFICNSHFVTKGRLRNPARDPCEFAYFYRI